LNDGVEIMPGTNHPLWMFIHQSLLRNRCICSPS
jgi:hypothetical protein